MVIDIIRGPEHTKCQELINSRHKVKMVESAIMMWQEGLSANEIARRLGVSPTTICRWMLGVSR